MTCRRWPISLPPYDSFSLRDNIRHLSSSSAYVANYRLTLLRIPLLSGANLVAVYVDTAIYPSSVETPSWSSRTRNIPEYTRPQTSNRSQCRMKPFANAASSAVLGEQREDAAHDEGGVSLGCLMVAVEVGVTKCCFLLALRVLYVVLGQHVKVRQGKEEVGCSSGARERRGRLVGG